MLLPLNYLVQHAPGDTGAEDRFPSANSADGLNDLGRPGFSFDQVPQRALSERLEHQLLLTIVVQYDNPGVRKQFADLYYRNSVLNLNNCISRCAQAPGRCQTAEGDRRAR